MRGQVAWKKVGSVVPNPAGLGLIPSPVRFIFGVVSFPLVVTRRWGDVGHGAGFELLPHQA